MNPRPKNQEILKTALADLNNVPYKVSLRWIFYRLLQKGYYTDKDDYKNKMKDLFSDARKQFYKGWHPNIIEDDTRTPLIYGTGTTNPKDIQLTPNKKWDKIQYQKQPLIILYEAQAMTPQFQYYTKEIPLYPFKGDPSIHYKWTIAKHIEHYKKKYNKEKPTIILYFGDADKKGGEIINTAIKDITTWCNTKHHKFIRAGLTIQQAKKYKLPEHPLKPNQYQWEALEDQQAKEIIETHVSKYQDKKLIKKAYQDEQKIYNKLKKDRG